MSPSTLVQLQKNTAPAADIRIGDLAKATGKSQRALRLYEELGLLTPGTRTAGNFRTYGADALERVQWIGKLQELGFTLQHIQQLVAATSGAVPKEAMSAARALYAEKQAEVAAQIARLQQLQRELNSSLEYLETCVSTCTAEGTSASCCGTCGTHGDQKAPNLVEGMRS
jgi:MerR family transcriptional regulator, copper efflux regulator